MPAVTVTTTIIHNPQFFSLQYWFFDLVVILMFMVIFAAPTLEQTLVSNHFDFDDLVFNGLLGFNVGIWVGIAFQIMPPFMLIVGLGLLFLIIIRG